ncbi:MAG: GPW/gp25 family protein [Flavobacteriaceae bacterium]|nr:GPW/gp25 family protein [Flavobacteriaceae bacterium]
MNYLKFPLDFSEMLKTDRIKRCSLEESVAQHLMMQITCRYGEVAGRKDFGSDIWELEFAQLVKLHEWEEVVQKSLMHTVTKYEHRLYDVKVNVVLSEVDVDVYSKTYSEIKRKAVIRIAGRLFQTGEIFNFNTSVYVSPLSQ